jgi:hypothetical protein
MESRSSGDAWPYQMRPHAAKCAEAVREGHITQLVSLCVCLSFMLVFAWGTMASSERANPCTVYDLGGQWIRPALGVGMAEAPFCGSNGTWEWISNSSSCRPEYLSSAKAKSQLMSSLVTPAGANRAWIVVTGDSIGRLTFQGLLLRLGLAIEAGTVKKGKQGYVFHLYQGDSSLSLAYVGSRFPHDIHGYVELWQQDLPVPIDTPQGRLNIPAPDMWIVSIGLHSLLYNTTSTVLHAFQNLMTSSNPFACARRTFWVGLPHLYTDTMPDWKKNRLNPTKAQWFEQQVSMPSKCWHILDTAAVTRDLNPEMKPLDGIHAHSCVYQAVASMIVMILGNGHDHEA